MAAAARARSRSWRPAAAIALALFATLAPGAEPARAEGAEDSFRDGMSALDQNKWAVAAAAFRAALAERPQEGGRRVRVYGTWLLDYLPHYYLGVALFQLGDLEGAAAEWRESRRQGAILATPLVADLERWEAKVPAAQPAGHEPPPAPAPAERAGALREATAPPPAAVAAAAPPPAEERAAPPPPASVPALEPARAAGAAAAPVPAPAAVERELLLAAARLYFDGRYRETLVELAAARWPGRAPARACVLESASAFALFRQAGGSETRYLERARAAIAGCPSVSARDRPDPRLFSPAFTRLFDEALAARRSPAAGRQEGRP